MTPTQIAETQNLSSILYNVAVAAFLCQFGMVSLALGQVPNSQIFPIRNLTLKRAHNNATDASIMNKHLVNASSTISGVTAE